jgi:hypothetical protein
MLTLAAAGQPPTTTELRRIQLVRMARDIGGRPADVAGEKFVEWFGRQTGWTIETRRSYRAGIRGFFRWAYRTKRVPDHLADELPKVREQRGQRGRRRPGSDRLRSYLLNQRNVLCLNRNHLFRSIRLRFAHNALPTQRNLPNWLVREQLMEAIKANLLSHQIGSFRQRSRYWSRFVTPAGS